LVTGTDIFYSSANGELHVNRLQFAGNFQRGLRRTLAYAARSRHTTPRNGAVVQFDGSRAMASGVTPKLWEMGDMVKVLEDWELARISVTTVLTK